MCGIVGLWARTPAGEEQLGALVTPMLAAMASRGADSAGLALYGEPTPGRAGATALVEGTPASADDYTSRLGATLRGVEVTLYDDLLQVTAAAEPEAVRDAVAALGPEVLPIGYGRSMEVIKGTGHAADLCARYGVPELSGRVAIGHTRMATESAVTPAHSHPFVPAADVCLIHNGSFSNHATIRRRLVADGIHFDSDNDTEVGARYLGHRLAQGDDLELALKNLSAEFDGFFTLLVATADAMALVRDPFACKPAVVAETADYVAVASEFRALAHLPGIGEARIFEPQPEEVYAWSA